jgi:hypothetical protein
MAARSMPPAVRSPRTQRRNRVLLGLTGLLLLLAGGAGVAAGFGAFGTSVRDQVILLGRVREHASGHTWVWAAVGALGGLLALLGLLWLASQFGSNRLRVLDVGGDDTLGRTSVDADAVTDAVTDEIEGYRGVRSASARIVRQRGAPALLVQTALDGRTDPGEVSRRIQAEALAHVRRALDQPRLPARVEIRLTHGVQREVR